MSKTKLIFQNKNYEVCASDRIFSVNSTKKTFGKYTTNLTQVREWTDAIKDSLAKGLENEVEVLCKSFINN